MNSITSNHCIEYKSVSKSFADQPLFSDLSLQISGVQTTAIVGESGSGKSTLLQMANGLIRPQGGEVLLFGKALDYDSLPEQRLTMGYCVQGAGLFPHMTVFENITLMARLANRPAAQIIDRCSYLLNLLGLEDELSQRYPYSLSGGQQQRVGLCRAMMLEPKLLMLDEPFSALDPITRESIHQEFLKLQKLESCCMVLVTHDMSEAVTLAQQIVILNNGNIEQAGSVEEIQNSPASAYVEQLFQGQQS